MRYVNAAKFTLPCRVELLQRVSFHRDTEAVRLSERGWLLDV